MKARQGERLPPEQIDYAAVKRYWLTAGRGGADTAGYMAHVQGLPLDAVYVRLRSETRAVANWLSEVPSSGRILDLGCGAGTWSELFARRYRSVVAVEQSASMLQAAKQRLAGIDTVEFLQCDVRTTLPDGPFDLVFLGGLLMYLGDGDARSLLVRLSERLGPGGSIILRETTVARQRQTAQGDYQAVYRSVADYLDLFQSCGFLGVDVLRNWGYTHMEYAVELVETRTRLLPFLPRDSRVLGALTWWGLRGTAPVSFWLLPRLLSLLKIAWPRLENHFFRLSTTQRAGSP